MVSNSQPVPNALSFPFELVRAELDKVEIAIREQVVAFSPEIESYISYICNTSGKRIRPALSILVGGACGECHADHIKLGVILELIHMATLVHDDVIDEADTRRKTPTANAKWGNSMAILLGDSLFSHALTLATDFNSIDICRKVGLAANQVCQGEVIQSQRRFDSTFTKQDYFRVIEMKTGALFAAACGLAANLSKFSSADEAKLFDYGMKLGTAYQIYDDCLDLVADESDIGKTLRTDLIKGKLTLPVLNYLEICTSEQKSQLLDTIKRENSLENAEFLDSNTFSKAIYEAIDTGSSLLEECRESISFLPATDSKTGLIQITAYLESLLKASAAKA